MSDQANHGYCIEFQSDGLASEQILGELAALLRREFPEGAVSFRQPDRPAYESLRMDAVAVATLIFTVPQGVLATWQLAERMKLRQRIERLLELARARSAQGGGRATIVLWPGCRTLPLDEAQPEEILDSISRQIDAGKGRGQS